MPVLLAPDSYASVRPLFQKMAYHLAAQAVLDGAAPGRIFVDDSARPRTAALIPPNYYRVYVSGSPDQDLLEDVIRLLARQAGEETFGCIVHYDPSNRWEQAIERVFPGDSAHPLSRSYYQLTAPPAPPAMPLPDDITISRVEEALLDDPALENRDALREELLSESPSVAYFFERNYGYLARDGQRLVAWCLAEYRDDTRYELGIETMRAYQRRGIATHLASAVVHQAFATGATDVGWHCWTTNAASIATALRVGFEQKLGYPVVFGEYRPV